MTSIKTVAKETIPLGKLQKTWAVILGNALVLCGGLFSHHIKFYSFMFLHKISIGVVCFNIW